MSGRLAIVNGNLLLPQGPVQGLALVVEGGRILGLAGPGSLGADVEQFDAGGRMVLPGLIDIHTHGALSHTFDEGTTEAFQTITSLHARCGVTALVATTAASPIPDLLHCLEFAGQWMGEAHNGAQVLGVHLEGPYMNVGQKGALDPNNLRLPDDGTADQLLEHHRIIRILTLAPELPGALPLIQRAARLGIVVAAGHSMAHDTHVLAAIQAGLRHTVHIWSAQSSTVREGPWRKPGLLEATLTRDELSAEMIADNRHLPQTLMQLAYRCKGPDRLCAVSDATCGTGLPEGAHFRMGAMEFDVHDGVGMMLDRTAFAGSTTLLNRMIPILTGVAGIPLAEAVRMVTLTPARIVGLADRKGSLEAGKDADIAIFDPDWSAWRTMIGGRWVC